MKQLWALLICIGLFGKVYSGNPAVVKIGSIFSFDSVIGKVAKIAIEEAVKDVNSSPDILHGTELQVSMQNSNCSGFMGMVEGEKQAMVLATAGVDKKVKLWEAPKSQS